MGEKKTEETNHNLTKEVTTHNSRNIVISARPQNRSSNSNKKKVSVRDIPKRSSYIIFIILKSPLSQRSGDSWFSAPSTSDMGRKEWKFSNKSELSKKTKNEKKSLKSQ